MNKQRRNDLQAIIDALQEQKEAIELLRDEEQECYDNLPQGIQGSERGEGMYDNVNDIDYAIDNLDEVISSLEDVVSR